MGFSWGNASLSERHNALTWAFAAQTVVELEGIEPSSVKRLATALRPFPSMSLCGWLTAGSAAAGGRGDTNGRLHPGAAADLVVLDRDPFAGPREDIHEVVVSRTFLAGVEVYAGDPS